MALRTLGHLFIGGALAFSLLGSAAESGGALQQQLEKPQKPKGPEKPKGPDRPKGPEEPKGPDEPEGSEEPEGSAEPEGSEEARGPEDPREESADESSVTCCFTNPYFEGQCSVSPGEDESCMSILEYLNRANAEGKTYCNTSLTRGGWASIFCEEE